MSASNPAAKRQFPFGSRCHSVYLWRHCVFMSVSVYLQCNSMYLHRQCVFTVSQCVFTLHNVYLRCTVCTYGVKVCIYGIIYIPCTRHQLVCRGPGVRDGQHPEGLYRPQHDVTPHQAQSLCTLLISGRQAPFTVS